MAHVPELSLGQRETPPIEVGFRSGQVEWAIASYEQALTIFEQVKSPNAATVRDLLVVGDDIAQLAGRTSNLAKKEAVPTDKPERPLCRSEWSRRDPLQLDLPLNIEVA